MKRGVDYGRAELGVVEFVGVGADGGVELGWEAAAAAEALAYVADGVEDGFHRAGEGFGGFNGGLEVKGPGFGVRGEIGRVLGADEADFVVGVRGVGVESVTGETQQARQVGVAESQWLYPTRIYHPDPRVLFWRFDYEAWIE